MQKNINTLIVAFGLMAAFSAFAADTVTQPSSPSVSIIAGAERIKGNNQAVYGVEGTYGNFGVSVVSDDFIRTEGTYKINVSNFGNILSVKGGVGVADRRSDNTFHYTYSVEPILTVSPCKDFTVFTSVKYNRAMNTKIYDTTQTYNVGVSYLISKNISVEAKMFNERGDDIRHGALVSVGYAM